MPHRLVKTAISVTILLLAISACTAAATPTAVLSPTALLQPTSTAAPAIFTGDLALAHVVAQMDIGDRPTGSEGAARTRAYIRQALEPLGWTVTEYPFIYMGTQATNVVASQGSGPIALIGAHYDTRRQADQDPDPAQRNQPVPGANDGASGVAVLLELGRSLDVPATGRTVHLVFFDAEDNGQLDGWQYIAGSRHYAANLAEAPEFVIIVDMVGDADQQLYLETTSTPALRDRIWAQAADMGLATYFVAEPRYAVIDDHTPFLERGIPAVDIIDFDYPYWHTTQDTLDKVSAASLERVGQVVERYLESLGR